MKIRTLGAGSSLPRRIFVPVLVSLVVTLWRLTGELLGWSENWFNPEAGGYGAIVGITWLAPVFGAYFALELLREGKWPANWWKAIGLPLVGMLVLLGGGLLQGLVPVKSFKAGLAFIWLVGLISAAFPYLAWRQLFGTLLAYGVAARLPIVLIMCLAMHGGWGTHYDAVPADSPEMGWWGRFVWLALLPQLLFWVSFTVVTGSFFGSLVAGALRGRRVEPGGN